MNIWFKRKGQSKDQQAIFQIIILMIIIILFCAYVRECLPIQRHQQDVIQGQVFKRSLTGLNSKFSFSKTSCPTKVKDSLPNWAVSADHWVKLKESEKKDKYLDLAEKTMEHNGDRETNCNWCTWYSHQKIGTGTGTSGFRNKRTNGDHQNNSIIEIGQWKTIGCRWCEELSNE